MIRDLISEYVACADAAELVDYSSMESVHQYNSQADRMRAIVDEVVKLGPDAISQFVCVLEREPASLWAAHDLVEKADLDGATLTRCFELVEKSRVELEARGMSGDAMGEAMWLREWRTKHS